MRVLASEIGRGRFKFAFMVLLFRLGDPAWALVPGILTLEAVALVRSLKVPKRGLRRHGSQASPPDLKFLTEGLQAIAPTRKLPSQRS